MKETGICGKEQFLNDMSCKVSQEAPYFLDRMEKYAIQYVKNCKISKYIATTRSLAVKNPISPFGRQ